MKEKKRPDPNKTLLPDGRTLNHQTGETTMESPPFRKRDLLWLLIPVGCLVALVLMNVFS